MWSILHVYFVVVLLLLFQLSAARALIISPLIAVSQPRQDVQDIDDGIKAIYRKIVRIRDRIKRIDQNNNNCNNNNKY